RGSRHPHQQGAAAPAVDGRQISEAVPTRPRRPAVLDRGGDGRPHRFTHRRARSGGCVMGAREISFEEAARIVSGIFDEQTGTSPNLPRRRGKSKKSLDLIEAIYAAAEASQPITGRGVGYKLFVQKLIPSMGEMKRVYRLLKDAREDGTIPWSWIVDETRGLEITATWANPAELGEQVAAASRRGFWDQQPVRCEVWSEKGTVRGVLKPVLDRYGVGFNPVHGFNSATNVYSTSQSGDGRELVILYVGDYDPSGLCMSEVALPKRLEQYG